MRTNNFAYSSREACPLESALSHDALRPCCLCSLCLHVHRHVVPMSIVSIVYTNVNNVIVPIDKNLVHHGEYVYLYY